MTKGPHTKKKSLALTDKSDGLSKDQEQKLMSMLPKWVPEKENTGTAMYQTAQEFLILLEDLLQRYHNFTEKEIVSLEKELKQTLPVLHKMELKGLSILNPRDMAIVGEIAQIRRRRMEQTRSGIALPKSEDIKKFSK